MTQSISLFIAEYQHGIIATVAGGLMLAAISGSLPWFVRRFTSRVKVRRIVRAADCDWNALATLHHKTFPDRLGPDGHEMKRWLSSSGRQWHVYLFVAEKNRELIGYLYAPYHRDTRLAFICWFAADEIRFPKEKILYRLLKEFLACFDKKKRTLRAVLTELDLDLELQDNSRKAVWTHLYNFGEYAEALRCDAHVITGIRYRQPLIDLNEIRRKKELDGDPAPLNGSQLLLYISQRARSERRRKDEAKSVKSINAEQYRNTKLYYNESLCFGVYRSRDLG